MIKVSIPDFCTKEQAYVIQVVLGDLLGLNFLIDVNNNDVIEILADCEDIKITLDTSFFQKADQNWLSSSLMPKLPLLQWVPSNDGIAVNILEPSLPVLFGSPGINEYDTSFHLNVDLFGSIFFIISRYEELINPERDGHNRFSAASSIAYKENFLERPIVDEYIEVLWGLMVLHWPNLKRKKAIPKKFITCDVDWPFDRRLGFFSRARKELKVALSNGFLNYIKELVINYHGSKLDKNRAAIDWIMDVNEQAGNQVSFFFIFHKTSPKDTDEDFNSAPMRSLLRQIHDRGHLIGYHPGYNSYQDMGIFAEGANRLKTILEEEGISQNEIGGRQHFLRWDPAQTARLWEKEGFTYDSTLSFADAAGFRCGTSQEFQMYDLLDRRVQDLKQRPLIVMEGTIIDKQYEGLGYTSKAEERFSYLKERSQQYGGTFTLLWHNSHLLSDQDKIIYEWLIK